MQVPLSEERQIVWEILAQFWVDTCYDSIQLDQFADRIAACGFSLRELDDIAYWEVCGAFATFTLAVFFTAGMALPDWYYPEAGAREKVASWLSRPRILSFMNPFWLAGYIMPRRFLHETWPDLRDRVAQRLSARPPNP